MILFNIDEIELIGTFSRGIPNEERVVFKTSQKVQLGQYGILLGSHVAGDGLYNQITALPIIDNFLWFGEVEVDPETYIFLYTCQGSFRITKTNIYNEPAIVFHWGKKYTIFNDHKIVPVLFRMDGVKVGSLESEINKLPLKQT